MFLSRVESQCPRLSSSVTLKDGWQHKPKLTLSLSLQATCPLQLSPLASALSCHPCLSFHCPHRHSWCPSGLALVWLSTTARPATREEGQSGKEMGCRGSDASQLKHTIAPSSCLCLLLTCGPCLVLPYCPSFVSPDLRGWRNLAHPLLRVALKHLHLAVIKQFLNEQ